MLFRSLVFEYSRFFLLVGPLLCMSQVAFFIELVLPHVLCIPLKTTGTVCGAETTVLNTRFFQKEDVWVKVCPKASCLLTCIQKPKSVKILSNLHQNGHFWGEKRRKYCRVCPGRTTESLRTPATPFFQLCHQRAKGTTFTVHQK